MRRIKRVIALMAFACIISSQVHAQEDIDKFLEESVTDAEKLIGAYISPFMKSLSSGLNQGWYNTAKPHKVAGFDLTITVNAMKIPNNELFFDVSKLNLTEIELDPTSPDYTAEGANAPTIFGPEREPVFRLKDAPSETFTGPPGLDLKKYTNNNMPVPIAHFAFGLPKGTEIKFRFVPKIDIGDQSEFNLFGIGVLHDVKQWIPGVKSLPFDLSAFAGYTKMKLVGRIEDDAFRQNARGVLDVSGATVQGLISKKMSVLTVYGGLGYNIAKSKLAMLGSYDVNQDGDFSDVKEKDPINLDFAASGPRLTAGFRLKLAVLTLHADYTIQKYKCLTAGIGINVR
jgi:hypothetical protein